MGDTQAEISVELRGDLDSLTCCRGSKVVVQVFADGQEVFRSLPIEAPGAEILLLCAEHCEPME